MPLRQEEAKLHKGHYSNLSLEEERIGKAIVNAAYVVHKELGPGLLERVYEACLCHVLREEGFYLMRQVEVPIVFRDLKFEEALRLDLIVEDLVICELKALETVNPVWEAQLLSHLRLTKKRLGYLINFNVPLIKDGIRRMVI